MTSPIASSTTLIPKGYPSSYRSQVSLVGKGLGSEEIVVTFNVMDDITEEDEVWHATSGVVCFSFHFSASDLTLRSLFL